MCVALRDDLGVLRGGARPLLACMCGGSLAHPLARLMGRTACLEALAVAGAVALEHCVELAPVDGADVVVLGRLVPA